MISIYSAFFLSQNSLNVGEKTHLDLIHTSRVIVVVTGVVRRSYFSRHLSKSIGTVCGWSYSWAAILTQVTAITRRTHAIAVRIVVATVQAFIRIGTVFDVIALVNAVCELDVGGTESGSLTEATIQTRIKGRDGWSTV